MLIAGMALASCAGTGPALLDVGLGTHPTLPPPTSQLLPVVHIAPARGWTAGAAPQAGAGLRVTAFAHDLQHPRWLFVLPNGDVLVAESNGPERPRDKRPGLRGLLTGLLMKRAGAQDSSAERITLLRDADGDGMAETRSVFLADLHSPFGMALIGTQLYVANTDALLRFNYEPGTLQIRGAGEKIIDLPAGDINHHWTKNVIASPDGKALYVTIGSNSNVSENGITAEQGRAAIWRVDPVRRKATVFATGLRNPNGMAWEPTRQRLWTVVNERDELGNDLVPDYLTDVAQGDFFGWPYSYFGAIVDTRVHPQRPDLVAHARTPAYALGAHTASLGLAYLPAGTLGAAWPAGMLVGQHGSWNRRPFSGYEVVFVPFHEGDPTTDRPTRVLGGFLSSRGEAYGRPVGVAWYRTHEVLVADDVGNAIWDIHSEAAATAIQANTTALP